MGGMRVEAERILGCSVDIVPANSLKPDLAERVLADIEVACEAIASYVARQDAGDAIVFDAIRVRLIEIGEAAKDIDPVLLATESGIRWRGISGMRDQLAHRYFDTAQSIPRMLRLRLPGPLWGCDRPRNRRCLFWTSCDNLA